MNTVLKIRFLPQRQQTASPVQRFVHVYGNISCLFWELNETQKYTLWAKCRVSNR